MDARRKDEIHGYDVERDVLEGEVIFLLINTEQNRDMLADVPSRPFMDLSVTYYVPPREGGGCAVSKIVDNRLAGRLGLTEEQLFKAAEKNTPRTLPPRVMPVSTVLDTFMEDGGLHGEEGAIAGDSLPAIPLWVITNEKCAYGAAAILYEGVLGGAAQRIGDDLYILPSSVHEFIVVPAGRFIPAELEGIVGEVNRTLVDPGDRLSGRVYHYGRERKELVSAVGRMECMEGGAWVWGSK